MKDNKWNTRMATEKKMARQALVAMTKKLANLNMLLESLDEAKETAPAFRKTISLMNKLDKRVNEAIVFVQETDLEVIR